VPRQYSLRVPWSRKPSPTLGEDVADLGGKLLASKAWKDDEARRDGLLDLVRRRFTVSPPLRLSLATASALPSQP
jgi:hypothetical protein